jgi:hypothetical protein
MGGLINSIFGGNSNKSSRQAENYNQGIYTDMKGMATPFVQGGQGDFNTYNAMLTGTDPAAFNNWLNSSDYAFTTKAGNDAINSNMAAKGLLNSGATLKAITQFGQDNAQQYRNNYMNQLLGGTQIGTGALGSLMGAGANAANTNAQIQQNRATMQANGVGNAMNFGLGIASMIPGISDERLKTDIKKVGRTDKKAGDLPVYTYRFFDDPPNVRRMGVMAQEVAKKRPDALGPRVNNFMTVNYGKLANA